MLSPCLFIAFLQALLTWSQGKEEKGAVVNGVIVSNLCFADDIDILAEAEADLKEQTDRLYQNSRRFGMKINVEKSKVMTIGKRPRET